MAKLPVFSLPLTILPKFPHIFSNILCNLSQSPPKSQRVKRRRLCHRELILVFLTLSCFPNFICFLSFFPLLTLSAFAGADTSAKDLKPLVIEVAVEFAPNVQVVEA